MAKGQRRRGKTGRRQTQPQGPKPNPVEGRPRNALVAVFGYAVALLGFCATALGLWEAMAKAYPLVTPQATDSSSSIIHFKVENPSSIFDMRDVTLACQVLKIETGPASSDAPVRLITPIKNDNGRVLSEKKHFTIQYRKTVDFNCGAESVFQMERAGVPYYPPRIEIEILTQFKTLWFQRSLASAGPFVAIRTGDKYQWTEGSTVAVEPIH